MRVAWMQRKPLFSFLCFVRYKKPISIFNISILVFLIGLWPSFLYALPQDGIVKGGSATIEQTNSDHLQINQTTDQAIIDWTSFDIKSNERVNFKLPSSNSVNLSRVTGGARSNIFGKLTSNGKLMLINPNGILFGPQSQIDVNSLIATTNDIRNEDFLKGNYNFSLNSPILKSITNQGRITVAEGGLAALVAPGVINEGIIEARLGQVFLGSGKTFTLDLYGDQLVSLGVNSKITEDVFGVTGNRLSSLINNSGNIISDGGTVILDVKSAKGLVDQSINMSGIIQARTIQENNGEIYLLGGEEGNVAVSGILDASGYQESQSGGNVYVLGDQLSLLNNGQIDVSGDSGGGSLFFGGDYQGKGKLQRASDIFVSEGANIFADAVNFGDGGRTIFWADRRNRFYGRVRSRGGFFSGSGGFVEVSGREELYFDGSVDTSAANGKVGTLLLDPGDIEIVNGSGAPDDGEAVDGNASVSSSGAVSFSISENQLESLSSSTNIHLLARNNIFLRNLSDNNLELKQTTGQSVRLTAETGNIQFSDTNDQISTNGGSVALQAGEDMILGKLNVGGGNVTLLGKEGGTISLGTGSSGLKLSNGELSNITANNLVIGGKIVGERAANIDVQGVIGLNNISNQLTLNALSEISAIGGAPLGKINFKNSASTFGTGLFLNSNLETRIGSNLTTLGNLSTATASPLVLGNNLTIYSSNGQLTLGSVSHTSTGLSLLAANGIALNEKLTTAGTTILNADFDNNGLGAFSQASGKTLITGNGSLSITAGSLNLNGSLNSGTGVTTVIASNGRSIGLGLASGDLSLNSTLLSSLTSGGLILGNGSGAIQVNGANVSSGLTLNGNSNLFVGSNSLLTGLVVNGPTIIQGVDLISNGGIIDFNGAVTLNSSPAQIHSNNQNIFFRSALDGSQNLNINAGTGTVQFQGNIGGNLPLSGLNITGPSLIKGINISTAGGNIIFNDSVSIDSNAVEISTGAGGGGINLHGTVDGAQSLTLNSGTGTVNIDGNVGGNTALKSVSVTGSAVISGVKVSTSNGNITFNNALTLDTGAVEINTGTGVGDINLSNTVDGAQSLTLNSGAGTVNIDGNLGSNTALTDVLITGPTAISGANITTSNGNVTFNNDVTLDTGSAQVNTGAGLGDITYSESINGNQSLTLNSGNGSIQIGGNVGNTTSLENLIINGNTSFNGTSIKSNSGITISGNLNTNNPITLNSDFDRNGTGDLIVSGSVNSQDLTLISNDLSLGDTITSSGDTVLEVSDGGTMGIGNGAGDWLLDQTELNFINTNNLTIGNSAAGNLTVDNIAINGGKITQGVSLISGNSIAVNNTLNFPGNLNLTSGNNISDSGATFIVGGDATFRTTGTNQSISLSNVGNLFGSQIRFFTLGNSGDVLINNSNAMLIGNSIIGGNLTATSNGNISLNGVVISSTGSNPLISLTSTNGSVMDGGSSFGLDVDNPNGTLIASTFNGFGTAVDPLEIRVGNVNLGNNNSGPVNIYELDGLNILGINQGGINEDVSISYSGSISGQENVILNGGQLILTDRFNVNQVFGNTGKTLKGLALERTINSSSEIGQYFDFGDWYKENITLNKAAFQKSAIAFPFVRNAFIKKYPVWVVKRPVGKTNPKTELAKSFSKKKKKKRKLKPAALGNERN